MRDGIHLHFKRERRRQTGRGKGGQTKEALLFFFFFIFYTLKCWSVQQKSSKLHICPTCIWPASKCILNLAPEHFNKTKSRCCKLLFISLFPIKIYTWTTKKTSPPSPELLDLHISLWARAFCCECNYPAVAHVVMRSYWFVIRLGKRNQNQFHFCINAF